MRGKDPNTCPGAHGAGIQTKIIMKKFLSKISLVAMALSMMPTMTANAANNITLSPNSGSSPNNYMVISWTAQQYNAQPTATTITISVDQGATLSASSTSLAGGTVSIAGDWTSTLTLTVTATTTAGPATYPVILNTSSTTPTNYSIAIRSSSPVDVGAALFYAYGGNQVTVTANVPATLSFVIKDSTDTNPTNSCALGTLSIAASSTCSYRLRIATNAANGFTATIAANHELATGSATITQVNDNAASAPGTEQYGIEVYGATAGGRVGDQYTGAVTEENVANYTFQTDTSPVPTSTQNFISYNNAFDAGSAPNLTNTTLVKHFANISGGTPAGSYSQVVTYTVTGSF